MAIPYNPLIQQIKHEFTYELLQEFRKNKQLQQ